MALDKRRISGWLNLVVGSVLVLAFWVCVVLLSARPEWRFLVDMTPSQSASVTAPTEELIAILRKQEKTRVEIYTFFENPAVIPRDREERAELAIHRKVQTLTVNLLRQYAALGGDRLKVEHVDKRRDPKRATDVAKRLGGVDKRLRHVVVVAVVREREEGGESVRKKVLFVNRDLAEIDFGDNNPQIPGSGRQMPRLLEYTGEEQISSAMRTLLAGGEPAVYLLEGHREKLALNGEDHNDYTNLAAALKDEGFKIDSVNLGAAEIPNNATILACLEPEQEFTDAECAKIHAWLKRGGRLFLNLSYNDHANWNVKLANLLAPLGVRVSEDLVAQLWNNAPRGQARFLEIKRMNPVHAITKHLVAAERWLGIINGRPIVSIKPPIDGIGVDPSLLKSSTDCWLAPRVRGDVTLFPPQKGYGSFCVGALIDIAPTSGDHPGKVVLLSGMGFHNRRIVSGSQKQFAVNCFEWLAERLELVPIDRDPIRPTVIDFGNDQDEISARLRRCDVLLSYVTPGTFLVLGLIVWWRRRRI